MVTIVHASLAFYQVSFSDLLLFSKTLRHLKEAIAATHLKLTSTQLTQIDQVLEESVGPAGKVYEIERHSTGKHASIMRYNLNQLHQPAHLEELCRR